METESHKDTNPTKAKTNTSNDIGTTKQVLRNNTNKKTTTKMDETTDNDQSSKTKNDRSMKHKKAGGNSNSGSNTNDQRDKGNQRTSPSYNTSRKQSTKKQQQQSQSQSQSPQPNSSSQNPLPTVETLPNTAIPTASTSSLFTGQGIDAHPFARGSVIEVLCYANHDQHSTTNGRNDASVSNVTAAMEDDDTDESVFFGDDDDDGFDESDEDDILQHNDNSATNITTGTIDHHRSNSTTASSTATSTTNNNNTLTLQPTPYKQQQHSQQNPSLPKHNDDNHTIRLADIIDRAPSNTPHHPLPARRWKYYVHYRDYNRRMDEWITGVDTVDRIVSPPSVGNAKVRALTKKRKKREREEKEEEERRRLANSAGGAGVSGSIGFVGKKKKKKGDDRRKSGDGVVSGSGGISSSAGGGDGGWMETTGTSPGSRPSSQRASSRRASLAIASAVQGGGAAATAGGSVSPSVGISSPSSTLSPSLASAAGDTVDGAVVGSSPSIGSSLNVVGGSGTGSGGGSSGGIHNAGVSLSNNLSMEEQERLRSSRRNRRKSNRSSSNPNYTDSNDPDGDLNGINNNTPLTRSSSLVFLPEEEQIKDKIVTVAAQELDEHEGLDEASLREHEEVTKVKNVAEVQLGQYRMDTWYFSPIPKEMLNSQNMVDVLYVCEFSLQFFTRKEELLRFQRKELKSRNRRHPPGNEIYRNGKLSMFEVDGLEERIYCQNLCYIAKLFLDHKTLYFDVDPFLFYVLCEVDSRGFHPVGYYSKEKYSDVGYNLACILTFPCHQRKGYGRFLIDFSYELSKKEEKVGSPEKPMSDLGQQAYKPYWTSTIIDFLLNQSYETSMSIMEISKRTSIMAEDIIYTLNILGLLKYINGVYFITAERRLLEELAKKHPMKEPCVDSTKLHWTPYLTDVKRDKFSIHSKKPSVKEEELRGNGGF